MIDLTSDDLVELAMLPNTPGYVVLLRLLDSLEEDARAEMSKEENLSRLIRITRFWQCFQQLLFALKAPPQDAIARLEYLKSQQIDADAPQTIEEILQDRFS